MTPQGIPLTGPAARQVYRPMKLWCDPGGHVEPRTVVCDGCGHRACTRHSRWESATGAGYPARPRRVCDDCTRKEAHRARL